MKFQIWKCIFILCIVKINGLKALKKIWINEKELLNNDYGLLSRIERSPRDHFANIKLFKPQPERPNDDLKNFPHGYKNKITGYKYDDNHNSLDRKLFTILKNKYPVNNVIFIVDETNFESVLNDLSLGGNTEIVEFTGDEMEDVLSKFRSYNRDFVKSENGGKNQPLNLIKMPKEEKLSELINSQTLHPVLFNPIRYSKMTDYKIAENIINNVIKERVKNAIKNNGRYKNKHKPDQKYMHFEANEKGSKTRDFIEENKHILHWFGPIGYKPKGIKRQSVNRLLQPMKGKDLKIFYSLNNYSDREKGRFSKKSLPIERSKYQEEHDSLTPKKLYVNQNVDNTTPKPKKTIPHYPFWNYWTYHKTLYQDECKGDLVRLGDLCVALPQS